MKSNFSTGLSTPTPLTPPTRHSRIGSFPVRWNNHSSSPQKALESTLHLLLLLSIPILLLLLTIPFTAECNSWLTTLLGSWRRGLSIWVPFFDLPLTLHRCPSFLLLLFFGNLSFIPIQWPSIEGLGNTVRALFTLKSGFFQGWGFLLVFLFFGFN